MYNGLNYVWEVQSTQIKDEKWRSVTLVANGYRSTFKLSTDEQMEALEKLKGKEVTLPVGSKEMKKKDWGTWTSQFVRKEYFEE